MSLIILISFFDPRRNTQARYGMASLVLLLEALVRCHRDHLYSPSKEESEDMFKPHEANCTSITMELLYDNTVVFNRPTNYVGQDQEPQSWKLAESGIIWP